MTIELIETLTTDTNKFKSVKVYYNKLTTDYTIVPAINGYNVFESYWQYTDTKKQALEIARQIIKQDKLKP